MLLTMQPFPIPAFIFVTSISSVLTHSFVKSSINAPAKMFKGAKQHELPHQNNSMHMFKNVVCKMWNNCSFKS